MSNGKKRIAVNITLWVFFAAVIVMMFGFSGQSGEESKEVSSGITRWILDHLSFIRMEAGMLEHILRKAAHFCMFAAEGFFLYTALRSSSVRSKAALAISAGASAMLAVFNELHQLMDPERSCQISDSCWIFQARLRAYSPRWRSLRWSSGFSAQLIVIYR